MANFFFKFKRALFLAIFLVHFPINLAKKVFPKQWGHTQLYKGF